MALRSFTWWFVIGSLMTLSVLMVQGGIRDLWEGTHQPAGDTNVFVYFGTTLLGGGLLAGCLALVMNRLR